MKEAERYFLEAWRIDAQAPGLEKTLKSIQLQNIQDQGVAIQEELGKVDALIGKGEVVAAQELLDKVARLSEARFDYHSKMLWEEPNHQLITSRIDALLKFHQARILEFHADTPEKLSDAHFLYVLAESSAGVVLSKDPKDKSALDMIGRIKKLKLQETHQDVAQQEEAAIQKDLRQVDQLLAKKKTAEAEKLLSKISRAAEARLSENSKFLEADSAFHAGTSRLDAQIKFHQARILELKADTRPKLIEAQDRYAQAEASAAAVLAKQPKDLVAREICERIRKVREQHKDAALKQEHAIQKDLRRVDLLLAKGDVEGANKLLYKTLETVDKRWNAHFKLLGDNVYFQSATARIDAEFKFYQARILELGATSQDTVEAAARVYALAEASIKIAIEKAPHDPAAYLIRARIRHVRENYKGAVEDFAAALAKAPDVAAKERIALQWSFYLQELKNFKAELKQSRELSASMMVPPPPFERYRALGRELAVAQALQTVAGSEPKQGLWIPDPKLTEAQIPDAKAKEAAAYGKEVEELSKLFEGSELKIGLKKYHEEVNQLRQKAGLKASDLPASVLNFVEIGADGKITFKPEPETPKGFVGIHGKSEVERKLEILTQIQNVALVCWNQNQAAAATDPLQKLFYESQALTYEGRRSAARLKMMDLYEAGKAKLAADPDYFEKNPEVGAMYEQTRQVLTAFSSRALDSLTEANELLLTHRAAMDYVPKLTQAKLNKVLIRYLRAEIDSGRAVTLDEALNNLQALDRDLKASGQAFKVNSLNMIYPGTKFDELTPGAPATVAYLLDEYQGWEKDKSFRRLIEVHTRAGLEQCPTRDAERKYNLEVAKALRANSDYSVAGEIFENLFIKDLEAAKQKISPERIAVIKKEAQEERPELEKKIREQLKKSRIKESEAETKLRVDHAVEAHTDLMIRSEAYGSMNNTTGDHDRIARDAWIEFNGMKDPNDEWDNLADHTWDAIKTEAIVMAVTLPLTLGVGTAVRAGMSGTKLAIRLLNAGRWVKGATQGGILVTGAAAEGLVQTLLTSAIHNRDFEGKDFGFNFFTSLAFIGGAKLWGRFANKLGIGDEVIQAAVRRGESVAGKRLGNFAGMMLMQTELSATFNYLMEKLSGQKGGPGFWSLERHLGEGVRQLAYHGGTWTLNKATRNWAANAQMRAKLKAESAHEHYLDLMKTGKHSSAEARKLAAELAHKEMPTVLTGEDPKKIGADLQFRKANRLVEKMGVDPKSAEGQVMAQIFTLSGDVAGLEKGMGNFKDLDGFIRERLNIDPNSAHGKNLMKHFSRALAHGKNVDVLLKEFPELGRMLESQDVAAKQLLSKAGVDKAHGQEKLASELVGIALEKGWSAEDMGRFAEVLGKKPELLRNVVEKLAGDPKAPFSDTAAGKRLSGLLLVDALRSSADFESLAATLKNMEAHAKAKAAKPKDAPEAAKPKAAPEAEGQRLGGVAALFAGVVTLFAPGMAHAADKAGDVPGSGGSSPLPWIVGAGLMVLGGIGAYLYKRGKGGTKAADLPQPPQAHQARGWGDARASGSPGSIEAPLDFRMPAQQAPFTIGRAQLLGDEAASTTHATFSNGTDGHWYVLDGTLDANGVQRPSTNGIFVPDANGQPVKLHSAGWRQLAPDQLIRMGNTWIRLRPAGDAAGPVDVAHRPAPDRVPAFKPKMSPEVHSMPPPSHALFGNADPRAARAVMPVFETRALVDAYGNPIGEAQICAGNKEGDLGIKFKDGAIATAKTTKGGRPYQEDGVYISRFTLPDGTEVKIIAGSDGAGGMGGGDVASSAFLQGIHARVAQDAAQGKIPLAGELFADGSRALAKQKELGVTKSKDATGTGAVVVIVGDQATIATAGDAMVALSRRQAGGLYETVGYTHIDNYKSSLLANAINSNIPGLYVVKGLKPGDRFTIGSDGAWENLLGVAYKDRGSSYMREVNGLPRPDQEVFRALNLFAEATSGRTDAAATFHDLAMGNIKKPGQQINVNGRRIQLPAKEDSDNIFALNYEHQNGPAATNLKAPTKYRGLEPVPMLADQATRVFVVPQVPRMSVEAARQVPGHIDLTQLVPKGATVEFYTGNPADHGNIPTVGRVTVQDVAHNRRPELQFVAHQVQSEMNPLTGFTEPLLMVSPQREIGYTDSQTNAHHTRQPIQGPFALREGDHIQLGVNEFQVVRGQTGELILVPDRLGGDVKVAVAAPRRRS